MAFDVLALSILCSAMLAAFVAAGCGFASRRGWSTAGAIGAGIAVAATASWIALVTTWIAEPLGRATSIAMVIAALLSLVATRAWRGWRSFVPLGVLVLGALVFSLGMLLMWQRGEDPFGEAERRYYETGLPEDDRLPALLASWLESPGERYLVGDWLPSDRPPLQAGFILIFRSIAAPAAALIGATPTSVDYSASVTVQLLWIPAAFSLLMALGYGGVVALAALAGTALVPVIFINTAFTWPKLLAAAFALGAIAVLVSALRRRLSPLAAMPLAAALLTFGVLSHGASGLVLPLVLGLAIALFRRERGRRFWTLAAVGAAPAVVAYLPWLLYQRVVAPPGDRLLKWHFAGVIPVDDRSFAEALLDQYRETTPSELVSARVSNLARALDPTLVLAGADIRDAAALAARAQREFFDTPAALGIGYVLAISLLATWLVQRIRDRADATLSWSALLVSSMFGCIAIWALVMFLPGSAIVHQGSHTWIVLLLAVPLAWLFRASGVAACLVVLLQLFWTFLLYTVANGEPVPEFQPAQLAAALAALASMAGAVLLAHRLGAHAGTEGGVAATGGRTATVEGGEATTHD